jgi:rhamnose utilization protein RhaD (predicted bifunctional aldolase and dehydrogenase)
LRLPSGAHGAARAYTQSDLPQNLWNDEDARGLSALEILAYRSRLLAADRSVVNIFGGNTSAKAVETDHLGRPVNVLWVKGSGADMATCATKDFAGLKLDEVLPLIARGDERRRDGGLPDPLPVRAKPPAPVHRDPATRLHAPPSR